jgi:NarL family two-component system response regulator LiaR
MSLRTRILLVDDHSFICELLGRLLAEDRCCEVVGAVHDARRAVAAAARLAPDLAVLDIEMPGICVFDALATMRRAQPELKAVFLSAHVSDTLIRQVLDAQARGYVVKTEPVEKILAAIHRVVAGGRYFSAPVRQRLVVGDGGLSLPRRPRSRLQLLTRRETEVLRYVARGMSKREIAEMLYISPRTVDQHCTHLMAKLDSHDRVQLSRFAIREGLIEA